MSLPLGNKKTYTPYALFKKTYSKFEHASDERGKAPATDPRKKQHKQCE